MSKLVEVSNVPGQYLFHCPGCKGIHAYDTIPNGKKPCWKFNGNFERPSFTPSLHSSHPIYQNGEPTDKLYICHFYVTDGKINYCGDCTHEMAGVQGVEIPDWQEENAKHYGELK